MSQPFDLSQFPDIPPEVMMAFAAVQFELSVERAKAVAAILKPKLAQTARIEVSGKAEMEPIADNKDEAGRRQNRRVDLNLTRTGD